ncbi:MAG: sugar phosphate isomerase/epimerase family protein [Verrucomicrobiota bacterium]
MKTLSRRSFAAGISTMALGGSIVSAIEVPTRINPRIKGLSLAAFSFRDQMRWMKGKEREGEMNMLSFLEYAAKEGFDAVEPTAYFFDPGINRTGLNEFKRRAHLLGLDISSGAIGNNFSFPPRDEFTQEQLNYTRQWIDHYADLGAPVIRVFAGGRNPEGATEDEVIDNVVANFEAILPYAEKRGVMLGIENHDFATNIDAFLKLLDKIDSGWLGVTWDSANIASTPDPYAELARIAPYAINAQVKVMTKIDGEKAQADLPRLINILRDADYSGYIVLEYEEEEDPMIAIPNFRDNVMAALAG